MKKDYTKIVMVLDKSGSMQPIQDDTIGGFNNFIEEQRKLPGVADVTVVAFSTTPRIMHDNLPVSSEKLLLSRENYRPSGNTALLDAVGLAITKTGAALADLPEADRPGKVIVVIMTDGAENASTGYKRHHINSMIKHQQEVYSWDFVFLGANIDAYKEASSLGIHRGSTVSYAASGIGSKSAYSTLSASVGRSRAGGQSASFTEEERKLLEKQIRK